jgi:hypothetical protein
VHFFLWLLFKNETLTRDNLAKKQNVNDKTCLFCEELETCHHLFFDCVIEKEMRSRISRVVGREIGSPLESIGAYLLSNRKFITLNMISAAALWAISKLRNDLCFQNLAWRNLGVLLMRVVVMVQNWTISC